MHISLMYTSSDMSKILRLEGIVGTDEAVAQHHWSGVRALKVLGQFLSARIVHPYYTFQTELDLEDSEDMANHIARLIGDSNDISACRSSQSLVPFLAALGMGQSVLPLDVRSATTRKKLDSIKLMTVFNAATVLSGLQTTKARMQ